MVTLPYCGAPPDPGTLMSRWNLDPVLVAGLILVAGLHLHSTKGRRDTALAIAGWGIASLALISPLCAWSVSLFSARIFQHLVLAFVAAPLLAAGLPVPTRNRALFTSALFSVLLWAWHMPGPYAATFRSDAVYWAMHLTLFGSAVLMWRDLLRHGDDQALAAVAGGMGASVAMGFLGAVITLAGRPLYTPHYLTTGAWGFTPLQDQQLGGALMWVPALALFLYAALRSLAVVWRHAERSPA